VERKMCDFLKKQFADRYFLFLIVFLCGFGIGYFQMNKNADKKYELGYLDACKDFYKGKTKYDLVKNEDGTVVWKKVDK
jgi:hypothetical protein